MNSRSLKADPYSRDKTDGLKAAASLVTKASVTVNATNVRATPHEAMIVTQPT